MPDQPPPLQSPAAPPSAPDGESIGRVAMRFGAAGIANTAAGLSVIAALELGLGLAPAAANFGGYVAGWILGYLLSRRMVFRDVAGHGTTAWRYVAAVAIGFAANQATLALARHALSALGRAPDSQPFWALFAQLCGMVCYTALTFVLFRWWVFAPKPRPR